MDRKDTLPAYDEIIAGLYPPPSGPLCQMDGEFEDTYGRDVYWTCPKPGVIRFGGMLLCEDHAEAEGYDPDDGLDPAPFTDEEAGQ
jgi:hypothetical protein